MFYYRKKRIVRLSSPRVKDLQEFTRISLQEMKLTCYLPLIQTSANHYKHNKITFHGFREKFHAKEGNILNHQISYLPYSLPLRPTPSETVPNHSKRNKITLYCSAKFNRRSQSLLGNLIFIQKRPSFLCRERTPSWADLSLASFRFLSRGIGWVTTYCRGTGVATDPEQRRLENWWKQPAGVYDRRNQGETAWWITGK